MALRHRTDSGLHFDIAYQNAVIMRTFIRGISIALGVLIIGATFSGKAEYRGANSPLLNLILGGALIFISGSTLVMIAGYILIISLIVGGGILGGMIGNKLLGEIGLILGFLGGMILGGWIFVNSNLADSVTKLKNWFDKDE